MSNTHQKWIDRSKKQILLDKTNERLEFEKNNRCYVYLIRDINKFGYEVDSVVPIEDTLDLEYISKITNVLQLRARYNNGEVRFVWLPRSIEKVDIKWFDENTDFLDEYSHKI